MTAPLRVGLAGLGTVGASVVRLLAENRTAIARRAGRPIVLARVASRTPKRHVDLGGAAFATDLRTLDSADVDVLVELIGGVRAARALVETALDAGRPVVTANKALLADCGDELFAKARARGAAFGYEASAAGGIPIVDALQGGLAANRVTALAGIVNGTSNYVLTEMEEKNRSFADALGQAQRLGYAEADPSFDVDGVDAAQKLAVLVALAFDTGIDCDGVFVEGVSAMGVEDIRYARELGFAVKHLAIARRVDGGVQARVHPALVPESLLIAKVSGVMNAVLVHGDAVGATHFVGPGAGGSPTASAVVADLIALARGSLAVPKPASQNLPRVGIDQLACPHYLRIPAKDRAGVFAAIAEALSRHDISIEAVIQRPPQGGDARVDIVILTNDSAEAKAKAAQDELRRLSGVAGRITRIRVADLAAMTPG